MLKALELLVDEEWYCDVSTYAKRPSTFFTVYFLLCVLQVTTGAYLKLTIASTFTHAVICIVASCFRKSGLSGVMLPFGAPCSSFWPPPPFHKSLLSKKVRYYFKRPLIAFLPPLGAFCTPKYIFATTER